MNKKKIVLGAAACLLVLGISFGGTYAYLISSDTVKNEFVVGENSIEVVEEYDPPEKLEPGTSFTKIPYIENTGNLSCFVRVRIDFSDSRAEEFCELLEMDTENWDYDAADGYYYYKKLLEPKKDTADSTDTGYVTTPLFKKVFIKTEKADGTSYAMADMIDFDILIYAESCQHNDHDGACADKEYKTVWEREGGGGIAN